MDIKSNDTVSLEKILNLGTLHVPKFQRDYSWSKTEWKELWEDIDDTFSTSMQIDHHYMGYMVLQEHAPEADEHFDIIDGQQRITTLSLLLLAAVQHIKDMAPSSERITLLFEACIGSKSPTTLEITNRLILNKHNNPIYSELLKLDGGPNRKEMIGSNRLLCGAFDFFKEMIGKKCTGGENDFAELAGGILKNLHFTYITASRDTNIYKIYQTLNARGLELSISDLLKNHLFTTIDSKEGLGEKQIDDLQDRWRDIEDNVKAANLAKFISLEWNRRNEFCRKKELFQKISNELDTSQSVHRYLRTLDGSSKMYAQLLKYDPDYWNKRCRKITGEIRACLRCLNALGIKSPHGLLLTALQEMSDEAERLKSILRIITAISVRYNCICQKQANIQEQTYSKIANAISRRKFKFDDRTKQMFQDMYPSDKEFEAAFAEVEFNSALKPKYLLMSLENNINTRDMIGKSKVTLEHILPKKPSNEWKKDFPGKIHENYIHRLGNMTLLPEKPNKELRNKPFKEKKKEFKKSSVLLTKTHVSKYSVWNPKNIDKHQRFLAKSALKVWFINWDSIK
ncbi:MAG: DUF262 domain-containing protein [Betaproteobacteria bacterium AqS2]|uniref:DUF262 domain-containing protein n=1 Tax=Candidatus Amphirhobacter heronislandensis TaxID=1732024 RepID=A0A930UEM2_9GAMM|nr:DUF262 domain-containing protein [Betaproteobacteria bacterium AqS2]